MSALKICPQCATEYPANERFCPRDGTALRSQDPQADLVGSIIADRYHVLRKLGEGGMGQVYLAEHVKMGRKSAVKVMRPAMVKDVDAISRFNREAANASRINHPNIAGIYDFGETKEGIIYLAMEFIEGQSLTSIIEQQGALVPARAADLLLQTSEALGAAHDMGIVHRDLKPDNIMVTKNRDGGDLVKVVDFGIAKAAGSDAQKVTKTGLVVGTPEYMSPEQLSGDKLDGRSDIYSLGLVAFHMLTGLLPFPSDSQQESMIMRLTDAPKTLTEMRPEMPWPEDLQAMMNKALSRDVTQRYQTAPEFGRDFFRTIERMPVTKAAQAGTQVLDSQPVPATRVGVADKTVAMPALQGATASVPVTRESRPKSNRTALYAGLGVIVAVAVGGVIYKNAMSGKSASPTDSTNQVAMLSKPDSPAVGQGAPGGRPDTATKTTPAASNPVVDPKPAGRANDPAPGGSTAPLEAQLTQLAKDARQPANDARVTRALDALALKPKTSREFYWLALARAEVLKTRQQGTQACLVLENAQKDLNDEDKENIKRRMSELFDCQTSPAGDPRL